MKAVILAGLAVTSQAFIRLRKLIRYRSGWEKVSECAGINRFGIGNERVLRRRFSQSLRPPTEGGSR
jgi:hypothetical protein